MPSNKPIEPTNLFQFKLRHMLVVTTLASVLFAVTAHATRDWTITEQLSLWGAIFSHLIGISLGVLLSRIAIRTILNRMGKILIRIQAKKSERRYLRNLLIKGYMLLSIFGFTYLHYLLFAIIFDFDLGKYYAAYLAIQGASCVFISYNVSFFSSATHPWEHLELREHGLLLSTNRMSTWDRTYVLKWEKSTGELQFKAPRIRVPLVIVPESQRDEVDLLLVEKIVRKPPRTSPFED